MNSSTFMEVRQEALKDQKNVAANGMMKRKNASQTSLVRLELNVGIQWKEVTIFALQNFLINKELSYEKVSNTFLFYL
ncbi:hypothetical protein L6475_01190 [Prevotella sp. E9-3]|uniref:hypothetical protein n=1 Tax=Prevotella sp. E9-3 TaxID=2913621 RepID=UPI001EDAD92A|nr:hypothetical protein [Prevotella sp. E9-3]UKK48608.1 hypothetical protein L6475_01190 [Prevotella sp. E9-3]